MRPGEGSAGEDRQKIKGGLPQRHFLDISAHDEVRLFSEAAILESPTLL